MWLAPLGGREPPSRSIAIKGTSLGDRRLSRHERKIEDRAYAGVV
jgi:hypothetical protein